MQKLICFICVSFSLLLSCAKNADNTSVATTTSNVSVAKLSLKSTAFVDSGRLPIAYTCDGASTSPPISWSGAPSGTVSYAVTMHHVPAPGEKHVYLVLYNIPAASVGIIDNVSGVGLFGINTVNGQTKYSPPCSQGPGDKWYTLTVYALSAAPQISVAPTAVTMDILLAAIKNTTLASGTMNVVYAR